MLFQLCYCGNDLLAFAIYPFHIHKWICIISDTIAALFCIENGPNDWPVIPHRPTIGTSYNLGEAWIAPNSKNKNDLNGKRGTLCCLTKVEYSLQFRLVANLPHKKRRKILLKWKTLKTFLSKHTNTHAEANWNGCHEWSALQIWFQFPLTLLPQQNKISTNRKVKIKHKNLSRLKSKTKIAHYLLSLRDMGYTWSHLSLEFLNAWKTAKSKAKRKKNTKKKHKKKCANETN